METSLSKNNRTKHKNISNDYQVKLLLGVVVDNGIVWFHEKVDDLRQVEVNNSNAS